MFWSYLLGAVIQGRVEILRMDSSEGLYEVEMTEVLLDQSSKQRHFYYNAKDLVMFDNPKTGYESHRP